MVPVNCFYQLKNAMDVSTPIIITWGCHGLLFKYQLYAMECSIMWYTPAHLPVRGEYHRGRGLGIDLVKSDKALSGYKPVEWWWWEHLHSQNVHIFANFVKKRTKNGLKITKDSNFCDRHSKIQQKEHFQWLGTFVIKRICWVTLFIKKVDFWKRYFCKNGSWSWTKLGQIFNSIFVLQSQCLGNLVIW